MVDDETPSHAFVSIEGTVSLSEDLDELLHWAMRIAARSMGEDKAGAYGKRNAVPGEILVRITPSNVIAQRNIAG
jgi:hypothetical protein